MKLTFVLAGCLFLGFGLSTAEASEAKTGADWEFNQMAAWVKALGLGDDTYIIGAHLTSDQLNLAQESLLPDSYPGTFKFSTGNISVVADEKTNLILAIYQQKEEAKVDEVKNMVGHLMASFGSPTTMAHGKIIYWAFDKNGIIDEQEYNESKALGSIDIIATVKFNSTLDVTPGMSEEDNEETGSIYYIITSDRLLEKYMKK